MKTSYNAPSVNAQKRFLAKSFGGEKKRRRERKGEKEERKKRDELVRLGGSYMLTGAKRDGLPCRCSRK